MLITPPTGEEIMCEELISVLGLQIRPVDLRFAGKEETRAIIIMRNKIMRALRYSDYIYEADTPCGIEY